MMKYDGKMDEHDLVHECSTSLIRMMKCTSRFQVKTPKTYAQQRPAVKIMMVHTVRSSMFFGPKSP